MERLRNPFQGVRNIIRFNRHFYLLSGLVMLLLFIIVMVTNSWYTMYFQFLMIAILITTLLSLAVSLYVYDLSNLYSFSWLSPEMITVANTIVNIHAGFDETSSIIKARYPEAEFKVFDFYDPQKHTEISIRRARKAYPPFPGTQAIHTESLPLADHSVDCTCLILAAHEIRDNAERIRFFKELNRALKPSGKVIVTEHLRDLPNFLAYNIGFFHFHSEPTWRHTFKEAGLCVQEQIKITPFITTFILEKNGTTS